MTSRSIIALACLCLAASPCASAGQSSANFMLVSTAVNAGVADMGSANFQLGASVGDPFATIRITSVDFQLQNGFRAQVGASAAVLNLLSLVSRKIHGATPFDLAIDPLQPLAGNITVEPRDNSAGHTLIFHFDNPVNSVTAASALDAALNSAATVSVTPSGNDAVVTLTNVADNIRLTVNLTGINGVTNLAVAMGFLIGDSNNTRSVNSSDISGVKARSGQVTDATNFKYDLNISGAINATDILIVKSQSGKGIP